MHSFLSRVDLAIPLEELLVQVVREFRLGFLQSHQIVVNGYQELNVQIFTTTGRFIVKIFSKEKTLRRIQDNVWGYETFCREGVPMPTVRKTASGTSLFSTQGKRRTTYLVVMDYVDGAYLYPQQMTKDDIAAIARFMAIIHTHTKPISRYYDTMGLVNLASQYKRLARYLPAETLELVRPVVAEFTAIDRRKFRHSLIHGALEPQNILITKTGGLCILDLGCMDYNVSMVDIAVFLANYTVDLSQSDRQAFVDLFLSSYQAIHAVSASERIALPTLLRAQYAVYLVRTAYYRQKHHDTTLQTRALFELAKRGLRHQ